MKVFLVVLICFFGYLVKCHQPPSDPVWPELFQQSFQEKFYYPVVGTHYTNGTYYYDYTNRRYRVNATMVDMTAIVALTVYVFSKIHPARNWLLMVYDG